MNLDGYALPIKKLKGTEPVESLDLSGKKLGGASAIVIASLISVNGGLTVANLLRNKLDAESAKMVAKQKGISLCGIRRDQTTADFRYMDLQPPDAILLASDLSQAGVTGVLTALDLSSNYLKDEGVSAVCEAIQSNKETKLASLNFRQNNIGPVGANALAAMVAVTGSLTSINLSENNLTNYSLLYGRDMAGITELAAALGVNGSLTSVELRGNQLGDEGWGAIFAAICSNKDSKIMSMDASHHNIGPAGGKLIAKALRMSVTGTLTSLDLSSNQLCGVNSWGSGTYTADGITAIADALRVNGSLTKME